MVKTLSSSGPKKGGTRSTRQHSFQSFSQKIANIKIDPVRKVRRQHASEDAESSFFQNSLKSWKDLNLSTAFVEFTRELSDHSDSLPHILHYKDAIFASLSKYISKRDPLSLEPLLSLLTHFAHDLGASFEPYFHDSILLLSGLVVGHVEAEVIEWTFNALAYLFKYLSRLLAADLRPLYTVFSPLLGKSPQKDFVTGFAAEAVGFLVRKLRDEPLRAFVRCVFDDLEVEGARGYATGVMSMFREACVGVGRGVHSRGPTVVRTLLEEMGGSVVCRGVVEGVVVALAHHADGTTFQPVLEVVCGIEDVAVSARLVFVCATVRKGTRIAEWGAVVEAVARNVDAAAGMDVGIMWAALKAAVVVLHTADMGTAIASVGGIVNAAKGFQDGQLFLPFCEFFADMDGERFKTFLLPDLQRFITSKWSSQEDGLCLLIPKLSAAGSLGLCETSIASILGPTSPIPMATTAAINKFCGLLNKHDNSGNLKSCAVRVWQHLSMALALSNSVSKTVVAAALPDALFNSLDILLKSLLTSPENAQFAALAGKALSIASLGPLQTPLAEPLSSAFSMFGDNVVFLEGVIDFLSAAELTDGQWVTPVVDILISNLSCADHDARSLSLRCLAVLYAIKTPEMPTSDIISAATVIEDTPLMISTARNISLYVRRLASEHTRTSMRPWERRIVPCYCFGLLTVKFASIWEDAVAALGKVAEVDEEIVDKLVFEWLGRQHTGVVGGEMEDQEPAGAPPLTRFECSNLKAVDEISSKRIMGPTEIVAALESQYAGELRTPTLSVSMARMQALKVLTAIPHIAEKRSRKLVPMFLDWSKMEDSETAADGDDDDDDDDGQEDPKPAPTKWLRNEQAAMLTLFTKFTNPRALYKADLVYAALLNLLASGDPKVQSLALKCVFAWRLPAAKAYEDNLNNLLDETRFRDEITHFVQIGEDESVIQDDHREGLMPVLLRLMYGRSLSRKNASSGSKGMASKRVVVLTALANFRLREREMFVDIALGGLADASGRFVDKSVPGKYRLRPGALQSVKISGRKQMGFVRMAEDMIRQLGTTILPFAEKILDALLYCLVNASKSIKTQDSMEDRDDPVAVKASRAMRQEGLKCLNALFVSCPTFAWGPYMHAIFGELVNPRLDALPIETSQNPSGLLQLFSTWANSKDEVMFLADYNPAVLSKIAQCFSNKSVKDGVVLYILKLVKSILALVNIEGGVAPRLLEPNVDTLLLNMGEILHKTPSREVLEQAVEAIARLAPFVSGNMETTHLVEILVFLLDRPPGKISPRARSDILKILLHFLPLCVMEKESKLYQDTFRCVSSLFAFFKDREGRETLAGVLNVFAEKDEELVEVAALSRQLNSFSLKRLDEPDFEQRLAAYAKINEEMYMQFSPKQWMPLLFNMLYFIRDNDELAIRTNASYTLKRFAESCEQKAGTSEEGEYLKVLSETVMPAMKNGARDQSELVRVEYVGVIAHIVKQCGFWDEANDMKALLADGDEEASFFNNILHIQQHRRARAIRRLAATAQKGGIRSSNIAHFFLPLVEHFVFDRAEGEHNLASHTVVTIGALAEQLNWIQYRALFKRYTGYLKTKPGWEKLVVRLIGVVVDALSRSAPVGETSVSVAGGDGDTPMAHPTSPLAGALPEQRVLAEELSKSFLPTLNSYLHEKEESTVSLRVPIAVSIAKLLKLMPDDMLRIRLPAVLTDVCHILRSRAQESRDMTRKTLTEITTLLGPQYFGFVLKELRGALLRGYQLHVLSFTMHSILVSLTPTYPPGALDYCLPQIVAVIMDDIFGVTGMEKDAEGYISRMKEVKSSKSYASMELMASTTTLPCLGTLIRPIHALLKENMNLKMARKIDSLLRSITTGLLVNKDAGSSQVLVFCYEVIQEGYKEDPKGNSTGEIDPKVRRYLINLKAPSRESSAATSSHTYTLTRFALDLTRAILKKHPQLMTPANLSGFVPVVGDALLSKREEIQTSALWLLTTIIHIPLPSIDKGAAVFVARALAFVKSCPSTGAPLAEASLKLMTGILRWRQEVEINETAIGYLLNRIKPDLGEPEGQGIAFRFLKAVMKRKTVIPEVYDVADAVAALMITDQTKSVRTKARLCYFQFLMEYPQGKGRLNKQLGFLLKNLDYVHQSGRHSVLEAVNLLITRVGNNLVQEIVGMFFVPLVMRLINDESAECREMTGVLLKKLLESADQDSLGTLVGLIKNWLSQDSNPLLTRAALQVLGLYFDVYGKECQKEVPFVVGKLQKIIQSTGEDIEPEWESIYFALQTWVKVVQLFPETGFSAENSAIWLAIRGCLVFPHAWVRLSAARLMGLLFAECAKSPLTDLPLDSGRGLQIDGADMIKIAHSISSQLNSAELSDELGLQVVKNLLFLGRCFYANKLPASDSVSQNDRELDDIEEEREIKSALLWLIGRISGVIRSERNIKKGLRGKKYALQWLAAMAQVISGEDLQPHANRIIMPLYKLSVLDDMHLMKDLKPTAQEIMNMIQSKLGTTAYGQAYSAVRAEVLQRRQDRKNKRSIQMVTDPEEAAKKKIRDNAKKRAAKKEKSAVKKNLRRGKM